MLRAHIPNGRDVGHPAVVGLGEGVSDAPGFVGTIEVGDDFLRELEIGGAAADGEGVLRGDAADAGFRQHVAEDSLNLSELVLLVGVGEIEGLIVCGGFSNETGEAGGGFALGVGGGGNEGEGGENDDQGGGFRGDCVRDRLHVLPLRN